MKKIKILTLLLFIISFILLVVRMINYMNAEPGEVTNVWYAILNYIVFAMAVSLVIIDRQKEETNSKVIWLYRCFWVLPVSLIIIAILEIRTVMI